MFFKKPSPSPRGVPLGDLEAALKQTTLKASRDGDTLVVKHERLVTRVEVAAPENPDADDGKIAAIVTIKTELPPEFGNFVTKPGSVSLINHMATLGAVTEERVQAHRVRGGRCLEGAVWPDAFLSHCGR